MTVFEDELTKMTDLSKLDVSPLYHLDFSKEERHNLFIAWVSDMSPSEAFELIELTDEIFDKFQMALKALIMSKGDINAFRPTVYEMFEFSPNKQIQDLIDEIWEREQRWGQAS